jgi:hypothetical protein
MSEPTMAEQAVREAEQIPQAFERALSEWGEKHDRLQAEFDATNGAVAGASSDEERGSLLVQSSTARYALREHEQALPYVHSGSLGVSILYLRDVLVAAAAYEGETKEQEHEFGDASYATVRATKTGRVTITTGQRELHSSDRVETGERGPGMEPA